jgi:hypothetical protein
VLTRTLASLAALGALAVAAPAAHADHVKPNLGLEVTSVDPATRTVEGIQHCTSPDRAGRPASFKVTPNISLEQFAPGVMWGIAVDPNNVILSTGDMPCEVAGRGPGGPGGPGGPDSGGPADGGTPFDKGFLNRVWKFEVEVDGAEAGKLSVTIGKIVNLPKRFSGQDDELLDQDAVVLLGSRVRIYEGGKRVQKRELDDADGTARVQGKLVPQSRWEKDEDDQPVPTIRAKKVYLAG